MGREKRGGRKEKGGRGKEKRKKKGKGKKKEKGKKEKKGERNERKGKECIKKKIIWKKLRKIEKNNKNYHMQFSTVKTDEFLRGNPLTPSTQIVPRENRETS